MKATLVFWNCSTRMLMGLSKTQNSGTMGKAGFSFKYIFHYRRGFFSNTVNNKNFEGDIFMVYQIYTVCREDFCIAS